MKLNKLVSTLNMEHSTWLKYRRKGVGGSDAGSICGLNPYSTAIAVFQDKVQQLDKASQKIKEMTLDTFTILGIAVLHDCFGFGQIRCQRFMDGMDKGAEYLAEDLATWPDYINSIKEQIGIDLEIRWNN